MGPVGASRQAKNKTDQERHDLPKCSGAVHRPLRSCCPPGLDPVVDVDVVGNPTVSLVRHPATGQHLLVGREGEDTSWSMPLQSAQLAAVPASAVRSLLRSRREAVPVAAQPRGGEDRGSTSICAFLPSAGDAVDALYSPFPAQGAGRLHGDLSPDDLTAVPYGHDNLRVLGDDPRPYIVGRRRRARGHANTHAPRLWEVADLDLPSTPAEDELSTGLQAEPSGPRWVVGAVTLRPWAAAGATAAESVTRPPRSIPAICLELIFICDFHLLLRTQAC